MRLAFIRSTFTIAILAGVSPSVHAAEAGNAGVSGEADFNMYCAECHGEDGKGDGPKTFGLSVMPPDLTQLTVKYGEFPAEKLARMIDGREPAAGHSEREMPLWGKWFKMEAGQELGGAEGDEASVKRRIDNVIVHLETLQQK